MAPQKAYIVHHTPGRVRVRIPTRRHDAAFFAEVQQRLTTCSNVQQVSVNPVTASVLICYPSGDLASFLLEASGAGLTELAELQIGLPPIEPLPHRLLRRLGGVNRQIRQATGDQADGTTVALLFLLGTGMVQLMRGQILGAAVPLLWYAGQAISGMPASRIN